MGHWRERARGATGVRGNLAPHAVGEAREVGFASPPWLRVPHRRPTEVEVHNTSHGARSARCADRTDHPGRVAERCAAGAVFARK